MQNFTLIHATVAEISVLTGQEKTQQPIPFHIRPNVGVGRVRSDTTIWQATRKAKCLSSWSHIVKQKLHMLVLEHAAVHCRCVTRETSQCKNVKTEIFTHVVEM